jgi:ribonucleoside-triphosphate reductase (thioredoxin)
MRNINKTYSDVIYKRTYSRWKYDEERRETWEETVERYFKGLKEKVSDKESILKELDEAKAMVLSNDITGSMRAVWSAGESLSKENAAAFNCAYTTIESLKDFAEIFYLLLCGCGVSYSCERQLIHKLPRIKELSNTPKVHQKIVVEDSKEGWAESYHKFLKVSFLGYFPEVDYSKVRPKGSILKTSGGRASGPEPLRDLIAFTTNIIKKHQGEKLSSDAVADLVCKIADTVVVGGTRRSATLGLTNPSDRRMAEYKKGEWWSDNPQRALVNVSSCYTEKPDTLLFLEDMTHLIESKSGERGIVNRESMIKDLRRLGRAHDGNSSQVEKCGVNPLIHLAA